MDDPTPRPDGYPPSNTPGSAPPRPVLQMPKTTPVITFTILGITILVFILQYVSQAVLGVDIMTGLGMKENSRILAGEWWRLVTPMFLHASLLHIGFNMYALYIFGPSLERHYGHRRFLALYLLCGFAGNVMSFLFSQANSVGASTAIFGLLGAEGIFLYQNRRLFGQGAQRALMNIVMIAAVNLLIGLSPGIDNWGHVGGLLAGVLFAWTAGPVLRVEQKAYPYLELVDERGEGDVVRTTLSVGLLFVILAAVTIYIRTR